MAKLTTKEFTAWVRAIALSNRKYSKIFGIGFNKTGTTSLQAILRLYGFSMPVQRTQEILLTQQTYSGNYEPLKQLVDRYDAFQDQPFSQGQVYVAADALFPNSKFILTERDPEEWYQSLCRFYGQGQSDLRSLSGTDFIEKFRYIFPGYTALGLERILLQFDREEHQVRWELAFDKEYRIEAYRRRNDEIKRYFHGRPGSLLVIDLSTEPDTGRICSFLNIPGKFTVRTPHLNKGRQFVPAADD